MWGISVNLKEEVIQFQIEFLVLEAIQLQLLTYLQKGSILILRWITAWWEDSGLHREDHWLIEQTPQARETINCQVSSDTMSLLKSTTKHRNLTFKRSKFLKTNKTHCSRQTDDYLTILIFHKLIIKNTNLVYKSLWTHEFWLLNFPGAFKIRLLKLSCCCIFMQDM